jgi:hypothetical protein
MKEHVRDLLVDGEGAEIVWKRAVSEQSEFSRPTTKKRG